MCISSAVQLCIGKEKIRLRDVKNTRMNILDEHMINVKDNK